jgi:hypothetical protein
MRVFIGMWEVAGFGSLVGRGLEERGHKVYLAQIEPNSGNYVGPVGSGVWVGLLNRFCAWLFRLRSRSFVHKVVWKILSQAVRPLLFLHGLCFASHFIFLFGQGFLFKGWDLPILRLFGKKILFVFLGSDSRPTYFDYGGMLNRRGAERSVRSLRHWVRKRKRVVRLADRWANWVVDNPRSSHFHERKIINWFRIGMPIDPGHPSQERTGDGVMKAVHAPSAVGLKGSNLISEAFDQAARVVPGIALQQLEGIPNKEVRKILSECDFAIDQLYSDTPMARFALECMEAGKPVIVGGEGWGFPGAEECFCEAELPSVTCTPEELAKTIKEVATNAALREQKRKLGLGLAEKWNYQKVAGRIEMILKDEAPTEWEFDARTADFYFMPCGLSRKNAARLVNRLTEEFGPSSLMLEDKPAVRDAIICRAREILTTEGL